MGRRSVMVVAAVALGGVSRAEAQLGSLLGGRKPPATVYRHARILTMTEGRGEVEDGSIVVVDGQIRQIGKEVNPPGDAEEIDLAGMTVTPGLIDVDGTLGMGTEGSTAGPGRTEGGDPTARAFDGFDRYAIDLFKDAVRNGVTVAYISASPADARGGVHGTGAVVRLLAGEGPWAGQVLKGQAALCVDLGSADPPTQRLATFDRVRKQFRAALDHREALETYKEDLEEYEKKVKERAEKAAKEPASKDKKEEASPKPEAKPEGKEPPSPAPAPPKKDGAQSDISSGPEGQPGTAAPPERIQRAGGVGLPGTPVASGEGAAKEDDLKKPTEPTPDRKSEVLLKAIDHEMPVRVRCQRSEDILNALELAKEFSIDVVIEGGAEAHLVAADLAKAQTPVVLESALGRGYFRNDELHRRSAESAAALERAGVKWQVGTGAAPATDRWPSRFVLLNAQLAAGRSTDSDPLRLVTAEAADFLGVADKAGRLRAGMPADMVVWTGDPLDPASRVDRVFVAGELLYKASGGKP